jgi:putative sigma-54 modulation protein
MIVSTSSHNVQLHPGIHEFVEHAIQDALSRFDNEVVSVDVFLKDVNGPKGGPDKQVIIRTHLRQRRPLITETVHDNLRAAIRISARRAKRAVRRSLRKARRIEKVRMQNRFHGLAAGIDA